ncbi:MAG: ABC transporter ATP-binding protein [Proteobacteria bacterium]|nr:ABC transporter ATP-binding protein [Pseudomonadota bacterium]
MRPIRPDGVSPADTNVTEKTPIPWKRVFGWLLPYWKVEVGLGLLMVVGIALSLVYPFLIREIVDDVITWKDTARLLPLAGLAFAATAAGLLLSAGAGYAQTWVTSRVLVDLRAQSFRHLEDLGPAWFARKRLGDVLSRMGGDLSELQRVATGTLLNVVGSLITLIAALAGLTYLQPRLLLVAAGFVPLAVGLLWILRPVIRRLSLRIRERMADISHHLLETFVNLRTVKAHGLDGREADTFEAHNEALVRAVLLHKLWDVGGSGAWQLLMTTNLLAVLVVGFFLVADGSMTVGDLTAFMLFQQRLYGPLSGLAGTYINLQRAAAPIARVFEILDARPLLEDAGGTPIEALEGRVEFDEVGFAYGPGRPVLQDVSFTLEPGRTLAVVGPSGVGKTTVIDLLFRFLVPHAGSVRLDGVDLKALDLTTVLSQVAMVGQQPALFSATLRENLRWLDPDATDEALGGVVAKVGMAGFIESLPEGLDTELGDRGVRLSEGQRQRIGLARALLRDPPLLVLDEVTSALDWESDRVIVEALRERREAGRTTLVVTHRMHLAAEADEVVVLDGGRVVQQGPHDELLAAEGLYTRLWALQTGGPEA